VITVNENRPNQTRLGEADAFCPLASKTRSVNMRQNGSVGAVDARRPRFRRCSTVTERRARNVWHQGEQSGTTEEQFTIAELIASGR